MKKRSFIFFIIAVLLVAAAATGIVKIHQKKEERIAQQQQAQQLATQQQNEELAKALELAEEDANYMAEQAAKAAEEARIAAEQAKAKELADAEKAKKEQSSKTDTSSATQQKTIYLTFDDGPCIYTPELLDMLDQYGVKVTFFVTYNHKDCMDYMARAYKAGHAIGVHTYSHVYSDIYASTDAYWKDFDKMQAVIYQQTGAYSSIFRFPGGASNVVSKKYCEGIMTALAKQAGEKGYCYFDWNVDSGDTNGKNTAEDIAANIEAGIEKNKTPVVLQHDIKPKSIQATKIVIEWALEKGYKFDVLSTSSPSCHHGISN